MAALEHVSQYSQTSSCRHLTAESSLEVAKTKTQTDTASVSQTPPVPNADTGTAPPPPWFAHLVRLVKFDRGPHELIAEKTLEMSLLPRI